MTTTVIPKAQQSTLLSIRNLTGQPLEARDGHIGSSKDFLFDDECWTVRYLVADTRKWLPGRKVLIAPYQFGNPRLGEDSKQFPLNLTKKEIKDAPPLESDAPVSRQYELAMARHYNNLPYWSGPNLWGGAYMPSPAVTGATLTDDDWERHAEALREIEECHVRSCSEVMGYSISALDGEIGQAHDFIVETTFWSIRWIVVKTGTWISGRQVVVSPEWIKDLSWKSGEVSIDLARGQIESAPEFDPRIPINRDYEGRLFDYYGRPTYW